MVFGLNMAAFATGMFEEAVNNRRERNAAEAEQAAQRAEAAKELGAANDALIAELFGNDRITGEQAAKLSSLSAAGTDIRQIAYALTKAVEDEENISTFGTGQNQIKLPFAYAELGDDEQLFNGLTNMEGHLAANYDSVIALAKNNPEFTSYLSSMWKRQSEVYYRENSGTNQEGITTDANFYDWKNANPFVTRALGDLNILPNTSFNTVPEGDPLFKLGKDEIFIPDENAVPEESGESKQSITGTFINIANIEEEFGTTKESMDNLATHHNMTQGVAQIAMNGDYITYGDDAGMTAAGFLDDDSKVEAIAYGSRLLAAGGKSVFLLSGGADEATLNGVSEVLTEVGKGSFQYKYLDEDIGAMTRAVFTITKPDATNIGLPPSATTGVSGAAYMKKRGTDAAEFKEQDTANQEAVKMLNELYSLQQQYAKTGFAKVLEQFSFGLVGQAKQLQDIFGSDDEIMAEFNQNLDTEENTTSAQLLETAQKYLKLSRNQQLNRMDALKLTLAAKMARAVDPSGRLSNQDFEIQLERLGQKGLFTTQEGSLEKLKVVLEEFEARDKNNAMLRSILDKDEITVEDRRFIKSYSFVKRVVTHRRKQDSIAAGRSFVRTDDSIVDKAKAAAQDILGGNGDDAAVFNTEGLTSVTYGDGLTGFISENSSGDMIVVDRQGNDVTVNFQQAMDIE